MRDLESIRIGVIGAGNIGLILLERLRAAGLTAEQLVVFDTDTRRAQAAREATGARVAKELRTPELCGADLLLLAAPPPAILGIVQSVAPRLRRGQAIVSFAAGVRLEWLEEALPSGVGAARVMPNAPSKVGQGFNPVSWGRLSEAARARVQVVLDALGETVDVPEGQMNWWVGLSGAAMRTLLPVIEGMIQAGLEAGVDPALARQAAVRVFHGTAALVEKDGRSLDELKSLTPMQTVDEPAVRELFVESARGARGKAVQLEAKLQPPVAAS